jgi:hypothetical protein
MFALAAALSTFVTGCGNTYRPVVSAINPVGPAGQPTKYAVVVSSPGPAAPGLTTFVDFSGDTILITANIGVNPYYLVLNSSGTTGYTLNSDKTVTSFDISPSLISSQILQTTLLNSNGVFPASLFPEGNFNYITQPGRNPGDPVVTPPVGRNSIAETQGATQNLVQELPIAPAFSPIYVTGVTNAPRIYAISQANSGGNGQVSTIETSSNTIDPTPIPVGVRPVYGVMTADARRAFILNEGSNNLTVINSQTNQLDTPLFTIADPKAVAPIWADFAPTRNELIVANEGAGTTPGSLSIISIPLCSAIAQPTNPNCDPNNPIDAIGFGTVLANVTVGTNTIMVSVLQDGTRAYVANAGDTTLPCALPPAVPGVSTVCSVSVVNLTTNTVTQTLYGLPDSQCSAGKTLTICGHPVYIAATTGTPTGKVYVVSKDSTNMTVIRTDIDAVDTIVPLQGNGVSVRVTEP